ncbi:hypothetical protein QQS21_010038 [Conoideocrella luteorostrata]|uniref:Zn(2)-C6 fungal-type domain-containing protein n=1 Tax=Conoideocrella luteorostrata TaxID=1105319 RepID=A0AAJ0CK93_9HYPO|nr:hypothetical protein QQS21_010038 [Conoideocrella luteorostrata]
MVQRSRGCLRCRQRRVKCDQARPSCLRCLTRHELCVGYRDEADLIFQHETEKVVLKNKHDSSSATPSPSTRSRRSQSLSIPRIDASESPPDFLFTAPKPSPALSSHELDTTRDVAVAAFFDKYVLYPCAETSSPGFLEHLPCLFRDVDVNVQGRSALRWAIQAAGFADHSRTKGAVESGALAAVALECYGNALVALGESLGTGGKEPDDYDLNCVVVLDIFESLFLPESAVTGSHAQGMAHLLRLRGQEQFYDARSWGLFQLAHHRIQKQQLAKRLQPLPESKPWLDSLDQARPFIRLEKQALGISTLCHQANQILGELTSPDKAHHSLVLRLVREMHTLEEQATTWRQGPEWSFKTLAAAEIAGYRHMVDGLPHTVQVHRDVWLAYEWNYHRTARILLHQQLLACLRAVKVDVAADSLHAGSAEVMAWEETSMATVRALADEVLSTVAQSFGDVDHLGRWIGQSSGGDAPKCQAIGAYLLLWPAKIIKSPDGAATPIQQRAAQAVFHRIRECTGMKRTLGSLSDI